MKRLLVFVALVLCASLVSCQCAEDPDVGPIEGDEKSAQAVQVVPSPLSARI